MFLFPLLSFFLSQIAFAEPGYEGELIRPIYQPCEDNRISEAFQKIRAEVKQNKIVVTPVALMLGTSSKGLVNHFEELFCDVSNFTQGKEHDALGSGERGYKGFKYIISRNPGIILQLRKHLPEALAWYNATKEKRDISFSEWKKHFDGSAKEALLAVSFSLEYAYKTIAGIGLGFALWEKGHSGNEAVWASRLAAVTYEAADLLYDHLQRTNSEISMANSNSVYGFLNPEYDYLLSDFKNQFNYNQIFRKKVIQSLTQLSIDSQMIQFLPFEVNKEFESTIALLAYYVANEKAFEKEFSIHFQGINGAKLLALIHAGLSDIQLIEQGALFATSNLKNQAREFEKPDFLKKLQFWLKPLNYLLKN